MSATKILWGQLIVVGLIVLAFVWAATQWTAWRFGYQAQLGAPWFELWRGMPVYAPPAFFWWWFHFDAYAPPVFVEGAYIASSGGFASILVAIAMSVWRAREARDATTYGSARFATEREVRAAGMLGDDRAILGRLDRRYLRHDGPEHVLCFAPTRSGKGVGLVVPTLLTWSGSAIVHDIKGENWTVTAGWRARFGRVLKFDPTSPDSDAYNPLLEVRRGDCEVRDVQNIADILVDPEGALERRNHWEKTSHSLLVGAILHILYAEADKTLAGVANFLSDPKAPDRVDVAGDDDHRSSWAGRRASSDRRFGARAAEQVGQRALRRAVYGHVVPGPIPRSGRGQGGPGNATGGSATWSRVAGPSRSTSSYRHRTSRAPSRSCGCCSTRLAGD